MPFNPHDPPPMTAGTDLWRRSVAELLETLDARPEGLAQSEAARRLAMVGPNQVAMDRRRHLLVDLARRLANPLVVMLLVASTVAGVTGDLTSFLLIVSMVLLSTLLGLVQERRAQHMAAALRQSIALRARVRREGAILDMPVDRIVPGDIILLQAGDLIPADGVAIEAQAAQVNQAALTGEPYPVAKRVMTEKNEATGDPPNLLLNGSSMIGGTATMLVVETGVHTRFGAIAAALDKPPPPTAFERGLHRLGMLIVRLTVFLVLFVLLAHLALGRPPLESFLFAMALAVGLTPELLPMIVTVALARGAERMARKRVVVKRLSAIHDLGQMDVLCTDKTGTLTEARITLVAHLGIDGIDNERVVELAAVNALFETGLKSPLDAALLSHLAAHPLDGWTKYDERPFDFERRRVSVLAEKAGKRIEIVKGAPEAILTLCTQAEAGDGAVVPCDATLRASVMALHDRHAAQGLRLLGVAWKAADHRDSIGTDDDEGLVFLGLCVFVDPPKASATGAVARLRSSGIRIKLISGDAAAVVQHLMASLAVPYQGVLCGDEIAQLSDAALAARVDAVDLYARVTPDQKLRIVQALQARGHTVGFLGDGINDAPAILAADVGLSVDGATDVAREAADMILLASDLNVLGDGVAEGRRTYANIIKYLRMGTSSNFGNMLTMALASLVLPFLPLTAVQLLINNMLYDVSQLGIPFDDADAQDLARPHGWDLTALVRFTLIMGPLSSVFDIATFVVLRHGFQVDVVGFRTAWFIESMATQILVVFVIRSVRPLWQQRPHGALIVSSLMCLAGALLLPILPIAPILGFAPLTWSVAATLLVIVLLYLGTAEALKPLAMPGVAPSAE